MKTIRWFVPLVLVTTLVGFGGLLGAQNGPPGPHSGPGHWGGPPADTGGPGGFHRLLQLLRTANALGITDQQIDQIETILDNARPQFEALADQLRTQREAWSEPNDPAIFDEKAARQFADAQAALHADLMVLGMQTRAEVFSVLTPEQREILDSIRDQIHEKIGNRRRPKLFH